MIEELKKSESIGFFVIAAISLIGSILFFTGYTNIVFWFGPVSTSLWEFGRLMFSSILIYSIIQYFTIGKNFENFFFAKTATLFIAPIIFIGGSYLIDLLIGNAYMITHIFTYIIAIVLGQMLSYTFMKREFKFRLMNGYAVLSTIVMLLIFLGSITESVSYNMDIFRPMRNYQKHISNR